MSGGPRSTPGGLVGLYVVAGLVATQAVSAQTSQPLHDQRTAKQVDVEKVVTLQFQNLNVAPDIQTLVFRLPGGGWGAYSHVFDGVVPLFSTTGVPTGTLGAPGPGPGEFKNPFFAMTVGKQLWVVDPANNRITAFDTHGTVIGDRTLPGRVDWVQTTAHGDGLLLSGFFGTPSGAWHTVARVTMNKADDQFGGDPATSSNPYVQEQKAAPTPYGEIWAVAGTGGRIDILKADDLQPLASTQLPEDLSQPEARVVWDARKAAPAPFVLGVTVDSTGILWIVLYVADAHWRPGMDPRADAEKIGDTLILAVSPRDRTIVGARRMDRLCEPVVDGFISCTNESATTIDVLRLTLEH